MIGNPGYIAMLERWGVPTESLRLDKEKVRAELERIMHFKDSFDPQEMAKKIMGDAEDVQFNPHFFENIKPEKK